MQRYINIMYTANPTIDGEKGLNRMITYCNGVEV